MAKMKSCGAKGYAKGGEMEDDREDASEKRSGSRKSPPVNMPFPRLPRGIPEERILPTYPGPDMSHGGYRMVPMSDQSRQRLKSGGAIRGSGIESKGKTKGKFV
jgi:hypothetical protein